MAPDPLKLSARFGRYLRITDVCDGLDAEDLRWTLARTPKARARAAKAQNG